MPHRSLILSSVALLAVGGCAAGEPQELAKGDCLVISGIGTEVREVPVVECDGPHEAEVYAVLEIAVEGGYDEQAVVEEVEQRCVDAFAAYVGESYATSSLDIFYRWPLIDAWEAGDRGASCAVFVPDESGMPVPFEGTLAAS